MASVLDNTHERHGSAYVHGLRLAISDHDPGDEDRRGSVACCCEPWCGLPPCIDCNEDHCGHPDGRCRDCWQDEFWKHAVITERSIAAAVDLLRGARRC